MLVYPEFTRGIYNGNLVKMDHLGGTTILETSFHALVIVIDSERFFDSSGPKILLAQRRLRSRVGGPETVGLSPAKLGWRDGGFTL